MQEEVAKDERKRQKKLRRHVPGRRAMNMPEAGGSAQSPVTKPGDRGEVDQPDENL